MRETSAERDRMRGIDEVIASQEPQWTSPVVSTTLTRSGQIALQAVIMRGLAQPRDRSEQGVAEHVLGLLNTAWDQHAWITLTVEEADE